MKKNIFTTRQSYQIISDTIGIKLISSEVLFVNNSDGNVRLALPDGYIDIAPSEQFGFSERQGSKFATKISVFFNPANTTNLLQMIVGKYVRTDDSDTDYLNSLKTNEAKSYNDLKPLIYTVNN